MLSEVLINESPRLRFTTKQLMFLLLMACVPQGPSAGKVRLHTLFK